MVLVVVAMIAMGAYTFTHLMNAEALATKTYGRAVQARRAAESGVDYVAAILADQKNNGILGSDLYDNPSLFQGQTVSGDSASSPWEACRFSVLAPIEGGESSGALRYGLIDEAGRLNLNALVNWSRTQGSQTGAGTGGGSSTGTGAGTASNPLLYLPNMTPEIADAIMDWLDSDDDPRESGAESDYYQSLNPSYVARNGPIHSLDELLLIKGVTPRLLYGEDANRNGLLDPNEDDGDQSPPSDDGNGTLDRGWAPYLTLYSRESNTDVSGRARINLNGNDLDSLFNQLSQDSDFDEQKATFILAYRLFGAASGQSSESTSGQPTETPTYQKMDRSGGAKQKIASVMDLIDASVSVKLQGRNQTVRLASPFRSEEMSYYLDTLLDRTTTGDQKQLVGRVNANTAASLVLLGVPGMTEELADAIVASQPHATGSVEDAFSGGMAWLLTSGTLTKDQFKQFEPYLTGRSQVYRVQVVGYFEGGGPIARAEAVIDLSGTSPRIRCFEDLTPLGRGFDPRTLQGAGYR